MAHLHQLQIENFKGVVAVTVDFPKQGVTEICGRNDQGKTSTIDAIWAAAGGKAASPEKPIRSGTNRSRVTLRLDELEIVREWDSRGTRLKVSDVEGNQLGRPQAILDRLFAKLGFDPFEFTRRKSTEQAAILRQVTGLDFTALDQRRKALFDERTEVNRSIKQQEATLANLPEVEPTEEVSAAELQARLLATNAANDEVAKVRREFDRKGDEIGRANAEINRVEQEIARLQAQLTGLIATRDEAIEEQYQIEGFIGEEVETAPIVEQIQRIEETNRRARAYKERAAALDALRSNRAHAESLTDDIEAVDAERARILTAAPFPVPGLSLEDDGITYNGIPFDQTATSTKIRVSLAICLALNPELRLVVVKDGSLLDDQSLALLAEWAEANACQVIVERVAESVHGYGVVIEEGRVKEASPELATS